MPYMEDFTATGSTSANQHVDVTRYGLGAQGIDLISAQRVDGPATDPLMATQNVDPLYPNSTQRVSFPVYDGHGNMICTVALNTAGGYSVQNVKRYDVWRSVRSDSGASTSSSGGHLANTDKRYCANLGHASDIETGLIYMRARYYEPATGRFLSEDPARDGKNWFAFGGNAPSLNSDPDGRMIEDVYLAGVGFALWYYGFLMMGKGLKDFGSGVAELRAAFMNFAKTVGDSQALDRTLPGSAYVLSMVQTGCSMLFSAEKSTGGVRAVIKGAMAMFVGLMLMAGIDDFDLIGPYLKELLP